MYLEILERIKKEHQKFNLQLQPPAKEESLAILQVLAHEKLCATIPAPYLNFLRITDGLDWDGLTIFATTTTLIVGYEDRWIQGVVEANLAYRDFSPMKDYVVFGEDGLLIFVYDLKKCEYQSRDRIALDVVDVFSSLEGLIAHALQRHLGGTQP